jgi:biotin synthase
MLVPQAVINRLQEKVIRRESLSREEALSIAEMPGSQIFSLIASANTVRDHFRGKTTGLCSIVSAKSGACSEDCSFCAQSSKSRAAIDVYPLLQREKIIEKALEAKKSGVKRFSLVTSGRTISGKDLASGADIVSGIKKLGLLPCASLGLLKKKELLLLKAAGLDRYHHNLEASEGFFPQICTTHCYRDKMNTIRAAKAAGLSVCSGGIFGMGETWLNRIEMAFALSELGVESVPINFLVPIRGTVLEDKGLLHPFDALKIISLYRYILPEKEVRICGGRLQVLGEFHSLVFAAGADGMITGNYLTTMGRIPEDDLKLIAMHGLDF